MTTAITHRPWLLLALLISAVMFVAVGCSASDDPTSTPGPNGDDPTASATGTETPAPDLTEEQSLRVSLPGEPSSLDPQRAADADSIAVVRQLYAGLLRIDENQVIQPDLAASIPTVENGGISEDGLTYTFTLKDDLKWSDGEPLVAQAFVDGVKRLFEPGAGAPYADFYRVIAAGGAQDAFAQAVADELEGDDLRPFEQAIFDGLEVTAPDDLTVVYQLNAQSPIFTTLATLWPLYPVRQDVIDAAGDTWTEPATHVSNGPFALTDWNHDEDLTLGKNEYSHRNPMLDTISIDIIPDAAVAFLAYQEGELDIARLGPEELVQVRGTDLVDQFVSYAQLSTKGLYFNHEDPTLADLNVRRALAAAVDRDEYAGVVREGAVLPAYAWVPPGMPGHDPTAGTQYQQDLDQARAWLADAGFPGGEGLEIEIMGPDDSVTAQRNEWLQQQWETNLGITVTIRALERGAAFSALFGGEFQVSSAGWFGDYPDPENWLPIFQTDHGLNLGNYDSEEFNSLVAAAETELDHDTRLDLYVQAQQILIDDLAVAPLYYEARQALIQPWVQGLTPSSMESSIPGDLFLDRVSIQGRSS